MAANPLFREQMRAALRLLQRYFFSREDWIAFRRAPAIRARGVGS